MVSAEDTGGFLRWHYDHLSQPIRVSDLCCPGEHFDTVENIGLRSTLIRTVKRAVVLVPNGQPAVMSLENFATGTKFSLTTSSV
jgi:small-conductance mechanosensitive channel